MKSRSDFSQPSYKNLHVVMKVENLAVGYKRPQFVVSENINLELKQGNLYCLIGPNGSGKSTFIRTLAGLIPPLKGNIYLGERELSQLSRKEIACHVSVVFAGVGSMPAMTAFEVAAAGRFPHTGFMGRLSHFDRQIVWDSLKLVGADALAHRFFDRLSDGEKQKVWIASALCQQTPLIMLDEPAAFLDFTSRYEIMHVLLSMAHSQSKTILLSTHDVPLALRLADQLIVAGHHKPLALTSPEEAIQTGVISHYFNKRQLIYNPSIHDFEPEGRNFIPIHVNFEAPQPVAWSLFLQRMGLCLAKHDEKAWLEITVKKDGSFELNRNSKTYKFENLSTMSQFLRYEKTIPME